MPDPDTLLAWLSHARGPIAEARRVVEGLGGTLTYTPAAMRALAEAAAASPDGAWLMRRIVDGLLEDALVTRYPGVAWAIDEARVRAALDAEA